MYEWNVSLLGYETDVPSETHNLQQWHFFVSKQETVPYVRVPYIPVPVRNHHYCRYNRAYREKESRPCTTVYHQCTATVLQLLLY